MKFPALSADSIWTDTSRCKQWSFVKLRASSPNSSASEAGMLPRAGRAALGQLMPPYIKQTEIIGTIIYIIYFVNYKSSSVYILSYLLFNWTVFLLYFC